MKGENILKNIDKQRGYTLFLTVLLFVVFSVIGLTLITLSLSGINRSANSENVTQASELAEKGLTHLIKQIDHDLQKELKKYEHQDGLKKSLYIKIIEETVDKYNCKKPVNEINENGKTGQYQACVDEYIDRGKEHLPQRIILKTTGNANEKQKEVYAVVEIDGNAFPDDMEYAINAFTRPECQQGNCLPGEGNLFIHGGASIQGDINVDRNLFVSDKSYEKYIYDHAIRTTLPMARVKKNGQKPRIIIGNDIYKLNLKNKTFPSRTTRIKDKFNYDDHISIIDNVPNNTLYTKMEKLDENVFEGSFIPELSNRTDHPGYNKLNILEELAEKKEHYKNALYHRFDDQNENVVVHNTSVFSSAGVDRVILNANYPNDRVFPKQYSNDKGTFRIRGKSTFKQFSTNGNILINPVPPGRRNIVTFIESAYIHGNMEIRGNSEVKGPIYVNGNLKIENDLNNDIKIDSTIYVNGDAEINAKNLTMNATLFINGDLTIDSKNSIFTGPIYVNGNLFVDGRLYRDKNITMNNVFYVGKNATIQHIEYDPSILDTIRGDHIIYANGKIKLQRINRFEDKAVKLNAYYYSNESIEIDGNESKMIINGGVAAPRIVINAIRGNSNVFTRGAVERPYRQITWGEVPLRYYDGADPQYKRESRLHIIYDDAVFKKYSHLMLESRVTHPIPGKIVDIGYKKEDLSY